MKATYSTPANLLRSVRHPVLRQTLLWGIVPLLTLFLCTRVSAQISVRGTVAGQMEGPLTGAYVYAKNDPAGVTMTGENGQFELSLDASDTLIVSFLGYETGRYPLAAADTSLALTLTAKVSGSIEALTVKARKIPYGELASARVGQLEIYLNPAAKADPLLAVNTLPAATNPDETANVSLRGSPAEATGIFLNEVPIRSAVRLDQSNGVGQFSLFGNVPLREVDVYAGAPPVNFSQTSAGAVALTTNPAPPEVVTSGLSLHLSGAGLLHARPIGKRSGLRAYVNWGNVAPFKALNERGLPNLRASSSFDGALQFTYTGQNRAFQLFHLGFNENFRFRVNTPYYAGNFHQRKPRQLTVLHYQHRLGEWQLAVNKAFDWERGQFNFGNSTTDNRRWHGHTTINATRRVGGQTLRVGAALNTYDDKTTGTAPTTSYLLRPESPNTAYSAQETRTLGESYVYLARRIGKKWLLGAGAKAVYFAQKGRTAGNTQASLRYLASEQRTIHLSGGRFTQLLAPGPALRFWQWLDLSQVALEYTQLGDAFTYEFALFAKRELYERQPDLYVLGAEAQVSYATDQWLVRASAATIRNRSLSGQRRTRRDLPFLARARVQRKLGSAITVGLAATWRSGTVFQPIAGRERIMGTDDWYTPIYASATDRLPNYRRVDLSISKMVLLGRGSLIVYLNVNNLTNADNVSGYAYDASFLRRRSELYSQRLLFFGAVYQFSHGRRS